MTRHRFKIGSVILSPPAMPVLPDPGIVGKVVRPKMYTGPRIDYAALRNAVTKGTKSSRQLRAEAERAARKAAKAAEKAQAPRSRQKALPPRELPNGID